MNKQVVPCAWCGKMPDVWVGQAAHQCPLVGSVRDFCVEAWNERQGQTLAARRADFNAARMAFRTVEPFKEIPGLLADLGGDDAWVYEDFDDYIAEKAE